MVLARNLVLWFLFLSLLLTAVAGFGVGTVELAIWLVLLVAGWGYLVRRDRASARD